MGEEEFKFTLILHDAFQRLGILSSMTRATLAEGP